MALVSPLLPDNNDIQEGGADSEQPHIKYPQKNQQKDLQQKHTIFNPRRTCARVVLCVCVCVCVYLSVPAVDASASVETSKQRYSQVSLRLFLDFDRWIFEKTFRSKVMV